jgi:hypothetical protein
MKPAQGRFVLPGEAPEIEAFYAHVDATAFWDRPIDPGVRADVAELDRILSLPDAI